MVLCNCGMDSRNQAYNTVILQPKRSLRPELELGDLPLLPLRVDGDG